MGHTRIDASALFDMRAGSDGEKMSNTKPLLLAHLTREELIARSIAYSAGLITGVVICAW